jgi:hypothetical protein
MISQKILDINKVLKSAKKDVNAQFTELSEKNSQIDGIVNDILHAIELEKMDAIELMRNAKQLKSALKVRRTIKNDMDILRQIRDRFNSANFKEVDKSIDAISRKTYTQRVAYEIRQEVLNGVEEV